jgi:hypothetical protein
MVADARDEDHAGDDEGPQLRGGHGLCGEACCGEYEAGHGDPRGAETPHEPSGDRGQRYRREPGESHQQHLRLVESELGLQQRTESCIHGDEAQQHGATSRVGQRQLASDSQCAELPVLPTQGCGRSAAGRLDQNRSQRDRGQGKRRGGQPEHPTPAERQRHHLRIDLTHDAGHQEGGRDGADPDGAPPRRKRLAHVCECCCGEACRQ